MTGMTATVYVSWVWYGTTAYNSGETVYEYVVVMR